MNVVGAMRVKNEARWIERSIQSILPFCRTVFVFDDGSTDMTPDLAAKVSERVYVMRSALGPTVDEVRDKNLLISFIGGYADPDWIIMIDGDEAFQPGGGEILDYALETSKARALAFPILYLWDREDQVRCDGVYGTMSRVSAFRPGRERFQATGGVNFHCGNAPQGIKGRELIHAPILHFGYLDRADRIRKYDWYNQKDRNNAAEDCYRHVVIGDIFPADSKFKHGGPLKLRPL